MLVCVCLCVCACAWGHEGPTTIVCRQRSCSGSDDGDVGVTITTLYQIFTCVPFGSNSCNSVSTLCSATRDEDN